MVVRILADIHELYLFGNESDYSLIDKLVIEHNIRAFYNVFGFSGQQFWVTGPCPN
jgi:hypothetical protein